MSNSYPTGKSRSRPGILPILLALAWVSVGPCSGRLLPEFDLPRIVYPRGAGYSGWGTGIGDVDFVQDTSGRLWICEIDDWRICGEDVHADVTNTLRGIFEEYAAARDGSRDPRMYAYCAFGPDSSSDELFGGLVREALETYRFRCVGIPLIDDEGWIALATFYLLDESSPADVIESASEATVRMNASPGTSLGDLLVQLCLCADDRGRVRMTLGSREYLVIV